MISPKELDFLKQYLGADGKLIITDDLTEARKERFEFINSLNLDLKELFSREDNLSSKVEDFDEESDSYVSDDEEDDDFEIDDEDFEFVEEEDSEMIEDLNDLF